MAANDTAILQTVAFFLSFEIFEALMKYRLGIEWAIKKGLYSPRNAKKIYEETVTKDSKKAQTLSGPRDSVQSLLDTKGDLEKIIASQLAGFIPMAIFTGAPYFVAYDSFAQLEFLRFDNSKGVEGLDEQVLRVAMSRNLPIKSEWFLSSARRIQPLVEELLGDMDNHMPSNLKILPFSKGGPVRSELRGKSEEKPAKGIARRVFIDAAIFVLMGAAGWGIGWWRTTSSKIRKEKPVISDRPQNYQEVLGEFLSTLQGINQISIKRDEKNVFPSKEDWIKNLQSLQQGHPVWIATSQGADLVNGKIGTIRKMYLTGSIRSVMLTDDDKAAAQVINGILADIIKGNIDSETEKGRTGIAKRIEDYFKTTTPARRSEMRAGMGIRLFRVGDQLSLEDGSTLKALDVLLDGWATFEYSNPALPEPKKITINLGHPFLLQWHLLTLVKTAINFDGAKMAWVRIAFPKGETLKIRPWTGLHKGDVILGLGTITEEPVISRQARLTVAMNLLSLENAPINGPVIRYDRISKQGSRPDIVRLSLLQGKILIPKKGPADRLSPQSAGSRSEVREGEEEDARTKVKQLKVLQQVAELTLIEGMKLGKREDQPVSDQRLTDLFFRLLDQQTHSRFGRSTSQDLLTVLKDVYGMETRLELLSDESAQRLLVAAASSVQLKVGEFNLSRRDLLRGTLTALLTLGFGGGVGLGNHAVAVAREAAAQGLVDKLFESILRAFRKGMAWETVFSNKEADAFRITRPDHALIYNPLLEQASGSFQKAVLFWARQNAAGISTLFEEAAREHKKWPAAPPSIGSPEDLFLNSLFWIVQDQRLGIETKGFDYPFSPSLFSSWQVLARTLGGIVKKWPLRLAEELLDGEPSEWSPELLRERISTGSVRDKLEAELEKVKAKLSRIRGIERRLESPEDVWVVSDERALLRREQQFVSRQKEILSSMKLLDTLESSQGLKKTFTILPSSRSEVRGIQTPSDQGSKHAAMAENLLGGHIQAVWGSAKTLGETNTQGKTITLTPEVYRVIQPYLLPLPGHLVARGVAPEKIAEMEERENVDKKSKVIIEALFNLANIKDAEAEALLRKLLVPRSLLNDEANTASIKSSIDKAMQGPMRNRILNGLWHLREAAAMMIMDIKTYERYENLPSVSVSPIKKTFILAEYLCMRGVENLAETDMNTYQLKIFSVLNAMTSLGIVARDGLQKFRVLEYESELYDRFAEDIANFLIKHPEDAVAILENVWHYPDIGLWYGVIDKLNQKGIRVSKKLTDIDTAVVELSGISLSPISFKIPARPSRPYAIFYKITFGRLPPTSLVYRDSFPYGEDYPGPEHKTLLWILAGMTNFLEDHPKNDLPAFLDVISKRKNKNEITEQQLWDIGEMLQSFAIKAYGLLSPYGPRHDQLKTVTDVEQAKGLISGMLQQRNAFMLQGMAMKKQVVQYFYEEVLKRNHLQPTWPKPLGLPEGMSDILNHYLWRCEYFFERLEYELTLLNAKGDMTGTNNTPIRSEVREEILPRGKEFVPGSFDVSEDRSKKPPSDIFALVKRNYRRAAVWMAEIGEAGHQLTWISWRPSKSMVLNEDPSTSRQSWMTSFIRGIKAATDFAWEWHPRRPGQWTTNMLSSSFSMITIKFFLRIISPLPVWHGTLLLAASQGFSSAGFLGGVCLAISLRSEVRNFTVEQQSRVLATHDALIKEASVIKNMIDEEGIPAQLARIDTWLDANRAKNNEDFRTDRTTIEDGLDLLKGLKEKIWLLYDPMNRSLPDLNAPSPRYKDPELIALSDENTVLAGKNAESDLFYDMRDKWGKLAQLVGIDLSGLELQVVNFLDFDQDARDSFVERVRGNRKIAQKGFEAYYQMLTDIAAPTNIDMDRSREGDEARGFPKDIYTGFLLPAYDMIENRSEMRTDFESAKQLSYVWTKATESDLPELARRVWNGDIAKPVWREAVTPEILHQMGGFATKLNQKMYRVDYSPVFNSPWSHVRDIVRQMILNKIERDDPELWRKSGAMAVKVVDDTPFAGIVEGFEKRQKEINETARKLIRRPDLDTLRLINAIAAHVLEVQEDFVSATPPVGPNMLLEPFLKFFYILQKVPPGPGEEANPYGVRTAKIARSEVRQPHSSGKVELMKAGLLAILWGLGKAAAGEKKTSSGREEPPGSKAPVENKKGGSRRDLFTGAWRQKAGSPSTPAASQSEAPSTKAAPAGESQSYFDSLVSELMPKRTFLGRMIRAAALAVTPASALESLVSPAAAASQVLLISELPFINFILGQAINWCPEYYPPEGQEEKLYMLAMTMIRSDIERFYSAPERAGFRKRYKQVVSQSLDEIRTLGPNWQKFYEFRIADWQKPADERWFIHDPIKDIAQLQRFFVEVRLSNDLPLVEVFQEKMFFWFQVATEKAKVLSNLPLEQRQELERNLQRGEPVDFELQLRREVVRIAVRLRQLKEWAAELTSPDGLWMLPEKELLEQEMDALKKNYQELRKGVQDYEREAAVRVKLEEDWRVWEEANAKQLAAGNIIEVALSEYGGPILFNPNAEVAPNRRSEMRADFPAVSIPEGSRLRGKTGWDVDPFQMTFEEGERLLLDRIKPSHAARLRVGGRDRNGRFLNEIADIRHNPETGIEIKPKGYSDWVRLKDLSLTGKAHFYVSIEMFVFDMGKDETKFDDGPDWPFKTYAEISRDLEGMTNGVPVDWDRVSRSEVRQLPDWLKEAYEKAGVPLDVTSGLTGEDSLGEYVPSSTDLLNPVARELAIPAAGPYTLIVPGSGGFDFEMQLLKRFPDLRIIGIEGRADLYERSQKLTDAAVALGHIRQGQVVLELGNFNDRKFSRYFGEADGVYYFENGTDDTEALTETLATSLAKPGVRIVTSDEVFGSIMRKSPGNLAGLLRRGFTGYIKGGEIRVFYRKDKPDSLEEFSRRMSAWLHSSADVVSNPVAVWCGTFNKYADAAVLQAQKEYFAAGVRSLVEKKLLKLENGIVARYAGTNAIANFIWNIISTGEAMGFWKIERDHNGLAGIFRSKIIDIDFSALGLPVSQSADKGVNASAANRSEVRHLSDIPPGPAGHEYGRKFLDFYAQLKDHSRQDTLERSREFGGSKYPDESLPFLANMITVYEGDAPAHDLQLIVDEVSEYKRINDTREAALRVIGILQQVVKIRRDDYSHLPYLEEIKQGDEPNIRRTMVAILMKAAEKQPSVKKDRSRFVAMEPIPDHSLETEGPTQQRSEVREATVVESPKSIIPTPITPEIRPGVMSDAKRGQAPFRDLKKGTRLQQQVPVPVTAGIRKAVLVLLKEQIDAMSLEDYKKLLVLVATERSKIRLVVPGSERGSYNARVAELSDEVSVSYRLEVAGSGKVSVIGFANDSESELKGRLNELGENGKSIAVRIDECFAMEDGIDGIVLALLDVPPEDLARKKGLLYDSRGLFSFQVHAFVDALVRGFTVISRAA